MPINVWPPEVIQDHFPPSLCTIIKKKGNWIVGQRCLFCKSVSVSAGHLCEFHTKQWGEPCSVPFGCLPYAFLQLIVCKSAVDCLKSWRAVLLLQDWWQEDTFKCTLTCLVLLRFGCCIGWALVWISYRTVKGALLCSCWLFAPCFSAIDSLQECSQLFEELKGGAGCFCRIGGRKAPSHAPYFLLTLLLFFVPYSTTWP
jgi:hypothetical protein